MITKCNTKTLYRLIKFGNIQLTTSIFYQSSRVFTKYLISNYHTMSGNYEDLKELLSDSSDWDINESRSRATINTKTAAVNIAHISTPKKIGTLKKNDSEDLSFIDDLEEDSSLLKLLHKKKTNDKTLFGALNQRPKNKSLLKTPQDISPNFWNDIKNNSSPLFTKNTSTQLTNIHKVLHSQRDYSTGSSNISSNEHNQKSIDKKKTFKDIQEEELELLLASQSNESTINEENSLKYKQSDEALQEQLDDDFDHVDEIDVDLVDEVDIEAKINYDNFIKEQRKNLEISSENAKPTHISISDESSPIVIKKREKTRYGNKFHLLTQRPGLNSDDNPIKTLNLPKDNKIMIPIRLSEEQENVIKLAEEGRNIFYTGSAGTGKSVLLRQMIKVLKRKYGHARVGITASTGLAACNIGGITVHSFTGIGLGKGDEENLYKKVRRSRKHLKRWQNISALIIDEISMLDGILLDKLNYIAQKIRKNKAPFGGIQIIFCGDFFQLPPVVKDNSPLKFAFESDIWKNGIDVTIMLQKIFRQQGDSVFIDMLNKMRVGNVDSDTEMEFKKLSRPLPDDEIIPAELYSTRYEVDSANNSRLAKLPGDIITYNSIDGGSLEDEEAKSRLLQNFLAPKQLKLKIGAQVMMIKNIDSTLVNGSLGKVIDFIDPDTYMFYDTIVNNPRIPTEELEKFRSNPELLKEAYEKKEEKEDNIQTSKRGRNTLIKKAFNENEETPVAALGESLFDFLADVTGNDSSIVENLNRKRELLNDIHRSSTGQRRLPLVRFKTTDLTTRTVLVEPEDWAIEDEDEKPIVSRIQLPLMLAWSLSIHKSQGQTLPKVKVDLKRVFEKGQAYVALSRAISRDGLQVLNFDRNKIHAHVSVVKFYDTLVSADDAIKDLKQRDQVKQEQKVNENSAPSYTYNKNTFKKDTNQYYVNKNKLPGIEQMLQNSKRHKSSGL
ncbi:hypothetical protein TPHA_0B00500 [Tetrapisispora phaffii CBS 4417]|uniref:ATP-dependent DNA helicase PIF1 n=1 Tax=Tetrapisispora phaffii (strain ATCC 24235 / CBS 4417 / NBRC 1672 / NRRL Y-8282 / UCD 70-5) TaxID=1071381 RepID=G8BQC5_TETPH|nr:hypothetical protein TPHA_0B00500 [Tetrapisispora phaffii CBS 4417]CCE61722.1 hypothetical protein TPHA_0B00500 [Tetrapisispora phaffii CBS 4417]